MNMPSLPLYRTSSPPPLPAICRSYLFTRPIIQPSCGLQYTLIALPTSHSPPRLCSSPLGATHTLPSGSTTTFDEATCFPLAPLLDPAFAKAAAEVAPPADDDDDEEVVALSDAVLALPLPPSVGNTSCLLDKPAGLAKLLLVDEDSAKSLDAPPPSPPPGFEVFLTPTIALHR